MKVKAPSSRELLAAAIASATLLSAGNVLAVPDQPTAWEKCAGIAMAGKNDCGALDGSHVCAGQATETGSDQEWVYVPEGTCTKIDGGRVAATKPAKGAEEKS